MSEVIKDLAIKLFGRTISLPRNNEVSANGSSFEPALPFPPEDCSDHSPPSSSSSPREVSSTREHEAERDKEPSRKELTSTQDDEATRETTEELKSPTSSGILENPKTPSTERETSLLKPSKNGEQSDTSVSQDKTPKKPDKILACPRCNSMDTKFCYYNNYNVNQPRHFCKNCMRYWTAGGTMRNVPVGAGRRKNKNSSSSAAAASHYRQIMVPDTLQTTNGSLHTAVLTFGSDSPLCDSMASVLSLAEKTTQNGVINRFHAPKHNHNDNNNNNNNNNGDDSSIGASVMPSNLSEKREIAAAATTSSHEESVDKSYQVFTPKLCFPGSSSSSSSSSPPWPCPWNPAMTHSTFCQPSYPVPFYPTPTFWGCMPPPSWSVHSISPQASVNYQSSPSSGQNSPTLGKHSREGDILFQTNSQKEKPGTESSNNTENNTSVLLIPKTLRIDDPTEAAKSSIWSTLGIKNERKGNSLNGGGLFKAFASKGDDKDHVMVEASRVLQANPAALSRSLIFHERT